MALFSAFGEKLKSIQKQLTGKGRLLEEEVNEAIDEVYTSLIEAETSLSVADSIIADLKQNLQSSDFKQAIDPGAFLIRTLQSQLEQKMGKARELKLKNNQLLVWLLVGQQGSGKTTTCAKLGLWLKQQKKRVALCSTDLARFAAIEQLENLCEQNKLPFLQFEGKSALEVAQKSQKKANDDFYDILLIDTAGRLHLDAKLMDECAQLQTTLKADETFYVIDGLSGQDALKSARAFEQKVPFTSLILTKADSGCRAGVALSVRQATQATAQFLATGEKVEDLEVFDGASIVSRLLGGGDWEGLKKLTQQNPSQLKNITNTKRFNCNDWLNQLEQMEKMGGLASLMSKLPSGLLGQGISGETLSQGDKTFKRQRAVIQSMTLEERTNPTIIKNSRKQRIAKGSGVGVSQINQLLSQIQAMGKISRKSSKKSQRQGGQMQMLQQLMKRP